MDTKSFDTGKIIYVDPNLPLDIQGFEQTPSIYDIPKDSEDYSVFINIEVEQRNRYGQKIEPISIDFHKNSFLSGKDINDPSGNTYLTDFYSFVSHDEAINGGLAESIGIESINIDFNSWYTPNINIKFVDIRGAGLLMQTEYEQTTNQTKSSKFFAAFFSMPYPLFKLTIKGFYGEPVTYTLHCVDVKCELNSSNGNFELSTNFIGYTYAILADLQIDYLRAAPYCESYGKGYWDSNYGGVLPKLNDIKDVLITNFKENVEVKITPEEAKSLTIIDEENNSISKIVSLINLYQEEIKKISNGRFNYVSNNLASQTLVVFFPAPTEVNADQTATIINNLKKNNEGLSSIIQELNSEIKIYNNKYKENLSFVNIFELNSQYWGKLFDKKTENNIIVYNKNILSLPLKLKNKSEELGLILLNTEENKHKIEEYVFICDVSNLVSKISKKQDKLQTNKKTEGEKIEKLAKQKIVTNLGFEPTIGNLFKIVFAHVDTLMYILNNTFNDIVNSNRNLGEELLKYPYPKYVNEENFEEWIGNRYSDIDEVNLVKQFYSAIDKSTIQDKNLTNLITGEFIEETSYYSNPLDLTSIPTYKKGKNSLTYTTTYSVLNDGNKEDFVYNFLRRAFLNLRLNSKDNKGILKKILHNETSNILQSLESNHTLAKIIANMTVEEVLKMGNENNIIKETKEEQLFNKTNKYTYTIHKLNNFTNAILLNSDKYEDVKKLEPNEIKNKPNYHTFIVNDDELSNTSTMRIGDSKDIEGIKDYDENFPYKKEDYLIKKDKYDESYFYDIVNYKYLFPENDSYTYRPTFSKQTTYDEEIKNLSFSKLTENQQKTLKETNPNVEDTKNNKKLGSPGFTFINNKVTPTGDFVSLFTSKIYQSQSNINEDKTEVLLNKAFLFLNTLPLDPRVDQIYFTNVGVIQLYKIKLLKIGSLLWRHEKYLKNNKCPLFYPKNYKKLNIDSILSTVSKRTENYAKPVLISDTTLWDYGNDIIKGKHSESRILKHDISTDSDMYFICDEFRDTFKNYFIQWVEQDFAQIDNAFGIENLLDEIEEIIDKKLKDDKYDILNDSDLKVRFNNPNNYFKIGINKDSHEFYSILNTESNDYIDLISSLIEEDVFIFNNNPLGQVNNKKTTTEHTLLTLDGEVLEQYIKAALSNIKDTVTNSDKFKKTTATISKDNEIEKQKSLQLLSMYNYLKNLTDKWVGGFHHNEYWIDNDGGSMILKHFKILDRSHNDISNDVIMDIDKIFTDYITTENLNSVYSLVSKVLSDYNFTFIPLPSYYNLSTIGEFKKVFEPIPVSQMNKEFKTFPNFICIYTGKNSSNLDVNNENGFDNDGFDYKKDAQTLIPMDLTTKNVEDINDMKINAFGVNLGHQNQNYFKNIKLNMMNPATTDQSIQAIYNLTQKASNEPIVNSQDLYNIYTRLSYSVEVEMMGCAQIQPMMHFQLNNVAMWHGAYMIYRVKHSIKAGQMSTSFTGMRINKNKTPLSPSVNTYSSLSNINQEALKQNKLLNLNGVQSLINIENMDKYSTNTDHKEFMNFVNNIYEGIMKAEGGYVPPGTHLNEPEETYCGIYRKYHEKTFEEGWKLLSTYKNKYPLKLQGIVQNKPERNYGDEMAVLVDKHYKVNYILPVLQASSTTFIKNKMLGAHMVYATIASGQGARNIRNAFGLGNSTSKNFTVSEIESINKMDQKQAINALFSERQRYLSTLNTAYKYYGSWMRAINEITKTIQKIYG